MNKLNEEAEKIKKNYRKFFVESCSEIANTINSMLPKDMCKTCGKNCGTKIDIISKFPENCPYREWQKTVVAKLTEVFGQSIVLMQSKILGKRDMHKCIGCGTCCKLAISEFSPSQLKEKATNGDNFAQQFISIFVPYENFEEAKNIYPEYFEMLDSELKGKSKLYYYHCLKIDDNNRCSDYENRPQICKDFPDNPLGFLPPKCGFNNWRKEVEEYALRMKAVSDIINFYNEQIKY